MKSETGVYIIFNLTEHLTWSFQHQCKVAHIVLPIVSRLRYFIGCCDQLLTLLFRIIKLAISIIGLYFLCIDFGINVLPPPFRALCSTLRVKILYNFRTGSGRILKPIFPDEILFAMPKLAVIVLWTCNLYSHCIWARPVK